LLVLNIPENESFIGRTVQNIKPNIIKEKIMKIIKILPLVLQELL